MPDTHKHLEQEPVRHGEVESLATQVLSALAQRAGHSGKTVDEGVLAHFCADILKTNSAGKPDAVADLRRQGIDPGAILDGYIPAAARELGDRWCRDELSFADVTIGTARLQAILRELSTPHATDTMTAPDAPSVMLIVPADEFHTLGGMAAASQMRRMGLSVCLCLGQSEDDILHKASSRQFDMISISVSCRSRLETVRHLVNRLRAAAPKGTPVVIGGMILGNSEDVPALTGADFATSDVREALRLCGVAAPAERAVKP